MGELVSKEMGSYTIRAFLIDSSEEWKDNNEDKVGHTYSLDKGNKNKPK